MCLAFINSTGYVLFRSLITIITNNVMSTVIVAIKEKAEHFTVTGCLAYGNGLVCAYCVAVVTLYVVLSSVCAICRRCLSCGSLGGVAVFLCCNSVLITVYALNCCGAVAVVFACYVSSLSCGYYVGTCTSNSGGAVTIVGAGAGFLLGNNKSASVVSTNYFVSSAVFVGNELGGSVLASGSSGLDGDGGSLCYTVKCISTGSSLCKSKGNSSFCLRCEGQSCYCSGKEIGCLTGYYSEGEDTVRIGICCIVSDVCIYPSRSTLSSGIIHSKVLIVIHTGNVGAFDEILLRRVIHNYSKACCIQISIANYDSKSITYSYFGFTYRHRDVASFREHIDDACHRQDHAKARNQKADLHFCFHNIPPKYIINLKY